MKACTHPECPVPGPQPLSAFYRSAGYKNGIKTWCKVCEDKRKREMRTCPQCGETKLIRKESKYCSHLCSELAITGKPIKTDITYHAAHQRVYRARGRASAQQCVDCRKQAYHWSYIGDDHQADGSYSYAGDPNMYEPRCAKCHKAFDRKERAWT